MTDFLICARSLGKSFRRGPETITPFAALDCQFAAGSFTALMGPSGSGKTTLLQCLTGIDRADSGELSVCGADLRRMSNRRLVAWRAANIGYIFQQHHLLPVLSAVENVELPLLLRRMSRAERRRRALSALEKVGLVGRADHLPRQLSGGQEQRVAIARALVSDAPLLVADEPTGNLDADSGAQILQLLRDLVDHHQRTIVMVTHDARAAARADAVYVLDHGRLFVQEPQATQPSPALIAGAR